MTIDFDQISPQHTPDVQAELDRLGGLNVLPRDVKRLMLVGHPTATATATAGEVKRITSVSKAMDYWGEGSWLAVMAEGALDVNPKCTLYGMSYAEGGAAVAGTADIVIVGNASGSGTMKIWIAGRLFQIGIANADTPTILGDALVAAVAQKSNLPFTASNAAGTITILARCKGPEGNTIRMHGTITAGITTAITVPALLATGATSGDPTSVLAGIEGERYHLICQGTDDATTLGVLSAHTEKQSTPAVQKWCIGIIASADTSANAQTLATGDDSYNSQIAHLQESDTPCFEMAARFAAYRASKAANKGVIDAKIKGILPAYDETKWPTGPEIEADIEGGVTDLRPLRNGDVQAVRSVLSRQTAPISYRDHNVEEIWHYTCEYLLALFSARMKGHILKSASPPGRPGTVTPTRATDLLNEGLHTLDKLDYLQGVKASIAAGNNFAEIDDVEPTLRLNAAFDYIPVGLAVFIALKGTLKAPLAV